MKKFTLIALSFIMIAMLMTGCRSKDPSETAGPTNAPTTATQAPTTATRPAATNPTVTPTSPSTGATDGTENGRSGMMLPRAY